MEIKGEKERVGVNGRGVDCIGGVVRKDGAEESSEYGWSHRPQKKR